MSWLILLVLLPVAYSKEKPYEGHRLISVQATSKEDLDFLANLQDDPMFDKLDFWTQPSLVRPTDIQVPPELYGPLQAALSKAGKRFVIKHSNIQAQVDAEADARLAAEPLKLETASVGECDHLHAYCTLPQIESFMQSLADTFPGRVSRLSIGQSYEGREIYYLKIVEDAQNPKDAIWIESGTHAREWAAVSCAVHLMNQLARQDTADAVLMLSRYDWYIVPVHNPDGYVYTHEEGGERLWRKNRQPCNGGIGTDLNRNWDVAFRTAGRKVRCSSSTYPGKKAFDAPETAALKEAIFAIDNVIAFFTFHAYSEYLMFPWAYTREHPADYDALIGIANKMVDGLSTVDGKRYVVGTVADLLYTVGGSSIDYTFQGNVPYSFAFEVRPNSSMGWQFELPPSLIEVTVQEVFKSLWAFAVENPSWFTPSK